jgi:hypothetical protein
MRLLPWSMAAMAARQTTSHTPLHTAAGGRASQTLALDRGAARGCCAAAALVMAVTTACATGQAQKWWWRSAGAAAGLVQMQPRRCGEGIVDQPPKGLLVAVLPPDAPQAGDAH